MAEPGDERSRGPVRIGGHDGLADGGMLAYQSIKTGLRPGTGLAQISQAVVLLHEHGITPWVDGVEEGSGAG